MGHISFVCNIELTGAFFPFSYANGGWHTGRQFPWVHQTVGCVVTCFSCHSVKQAELTAEMVVHFPWPKCLDNPGIFLFPKLLVCLDCGSSRFSVPEKELALLASGAPKSDCSTAQQGVNAVAPRNTKVASAGAMKF